MRRLRLLEDAEADVFELLDFYEDDLGYAAALLENLIERAERLLTEHPRIGRPTEISGVRELVLDQYILPYRVTDETIDILRLFHAARDPRTK